MYDIEKLKTDRKQRERIWDSFSKTNGWLVLPLLEKLNIKGPIWDCASGTGDLSEALRKFSFEVYSSDAYPKGENLFSPEAKVLPFIRMKGIPNKAQTLIANPFPPSGAYDQGCTPNDFIDHMLSFLNQEARLIAVLMRSGFKEGHPTKRRKLFGQCRDYMGEIVVTTRPRWDLMEESPDSEVSPKNHCSWFLWKKDWRKDHKHPIQLFHYAPEGFKP